VVVVKIVVLELVVVAVVTQVVGLVTYVLLRELANEDLSLAMRKVTRSLHAGY